MMKKILVSCLVMSLMNLLAQSQAGAAPASDDPMAGLNLGDSTATPPDDGLPPSPFVAKLKGHLVVLDHGTMKEFDASTLKGVRYWAFYYSASWCAPCRAFTPQLVDFYNYFKKSHPNFELIYVNDDQNEANMLGYVKADNMPWPSVKFSDIGSSQLKTYCGPGIPCLVLTDENGKVLSDSFHGQDYVGPGQVMEDIKKMVPRPEGN